jgi:hypothetical protein
MPTIVTAEDIRSTIEIVNKAMVDYEATDSNKQKEAVLKQAFVATCRLLKKILASNFFDEYEKLIAGLEPGYARTLGDLARDHPALAILHDPDQFNNFLENERELLLNAKFDTDYAAYLIQSVRHSYEELFREDFTPPNFRGTVNAFKEVICNAKIKSKGDGSRILIFLGGLALISVDTAAAIVAPIPAALSGAIGGAFVSQVAGVVAA